MRVLFVLIFAFVINGLFSQDSCFSRAPFVPHLLQTDSGNVFAPDFDPYLDTYFGCTAPAFNVTTITGKKIALNDLTGKPVFIDFWFTTCAGCIREFKSLNKLADEFASRGVEFIAFALDDTAKLNAFLGTHPLHFDIVPLSRDVLDLYQVPVCPFNFVLDKRHRVVKIMHGLMAKQRYEMEDYDRMKPFLIKALNLE